MAVKAHCAFTAQDASTAAVLTSATINVYTPGTVTPVPATIFDKNNNVLSNPLTADPTTGLVDFYLTVAQEVDLVVSKGGYTTRTFSNVPVLDDASLDLTALLTTTGDIPYASSANAPARLAIGATNSVLQVIGGVPTWEPTVGIGTAPSTSFGLSIAPTLTVSAATLQAGILSNPTMTAAANGDTLAGAYISGSYAPGGKTNVTAVGLELAAVTGANANNYGLLVATPSGGTINAGIRVSGGATAGILIDTGGLLIGGTPTPTAGTFGLSSGNAAPNGSVTALTGALKGSGSGPASAAVSTWIAAWNGTTVGWVPFFV